MKVGRKKIMEIENVGNLKMHKQMLIYKWYVLISSGSGHQAHFRLYPDILQQDREGTYSQQNKT